MQCHCIPRNPDAEETESKFGKNEIETQYPIPLTDCRTSGVCERAVRRSIASHRKGELCSPLKDRGELAKLKEKRFRHITRIDVDTEREKVIYRKGEIAEKRARETG